MVVRILKSASSFRPSFRYNEGKVNKGLACVATSFNLSSDDPYTIDKVFTQYETNPSVSARMRNFVFHVAFNPGPADDVDEKRILEFVKEYLAKIGYDRQPAVLYKHYDIEREHYHLIAPTMDVNGRAIRYNFNGSNFSFVNTHSIMRELGAKYGFSVGRGDCTHVSKMKDLDSSLYTTAKQDGSLSESMEAVYRKALEFNFRSEQDFADTLRTMGAAYRKIPVRQGTTFNVMLQRCDRAGKILSRAINVDERMKGAYETLVDQIGRNNRNPVEDEAERIRMKAVCEYCLPRAESAEMFRRMLSEAGLRLILHRKDDKAKSVLTEGKKLLPVVGVSIVDIPERRIYSNERLKGILDIGAITEAENRGRWKDVHETFPVGKQFLTTEMREVINEEIFRRTDEYNWQMGLYPTTEEVEMNHIRM